MTTLYVAAESGIVSMFSACSKGLQNVGQAFLANNAHVVAVDQRTHRVYFLVLDETGSKMIVTQPTKT